MINNISLVNRGVKSVFYICTICFFCISILTYIFRAPAHAADTFVTNSTDQTSLKVIFDLMAELFGGNTKSSEEQMRSQCASLAEIEKYLNENPEHKAEAEKQLAELRQSCANHPPTTKLDVDIPDDIQVSDDERFPYVNYGLTYTIPIRDTTVLPRADVVNVIQRGQLSNFRSAKVEYIPAITETAIKLGWNPAFLITLWLEETGGSMYTIPPYGAGLGKAASHMGCNPFGGVRTIQHEIENCIHASFGHFTNSQFANFMARYSTGSCTTPCDSNDQTCRKDVKADLMRGICTGNPFKSPDQKANNPHFPAGIRAVYNLVVPPGSHGALVEYSGKSANPKPLVTQTDERDRVPSIPSVSNPPSQTQGFSTGKYIYFPQASSLAFNAPWATLGLTGCTGTFASDGCGMASAAMIYSSYTGTQVNPKQFLDMFIPASQRKTCMFEYPTFAKLLSERGIQTAPAVYTNGVALHSAEGQKLLSKYIDAGSTVLMYGLVHGKGANQAYKHFIWIVGRDPTRGYIVMDPYWGAPPRASQLFVPIYSSQYVSVTINNFLPIAAL